MAEAFGIVADTSANGESHMKGTDSHVTSSTVYIGHHTVHKTGARRRTYIDLSPHVQCGRNVATTHMSQKGRVSMSGARVRV